MKRIIFYTLMFLSIQSVFGQRFEKIKALKTAYISDRLELTASEAEKFWPVYNLYEKELHQYQVVDKMGIFQQIADYGGVNNMSEKESTDLLQKAMDLNDKINSIEKNKIVALKKVISSQKILKLMKAEETFKRDLFKMLQERRGMK